MIATGPLWSAGGRALPRLVGPHRADICVVGLGGSGLSALEALLPAARAGRRIIGLDARGVAAGAAGRNGGFLLAGPAEPYAEARARLGDAARSLYELTLEGLDRLFSTLKHADRSGGLRIPGDPEELEALRVELEALHADGFEAEWRTASPEARLGGRFGAELGLRIPVEGVFDPALRCAQLAAAVEGSISLFGESPVQALEPERVRTAHGEVRAEVVLVLVDGRLEQLVPSLAKRIRSLRLQMLATAPASDVRIEGAVYHRRGFDYWQQRPDGRIALGGGRDLGGEAEETSALGVSEAVQAGLETLLRGTIGTRAPVTHRWSGIVAYSEDGLPIVEETQPGVLVGGAYSGHGNVLGALAGRALAELALGRPEPELCRTLRAARFILSEKRQSSPELLS